MGCGTGATGPDGDAIRARDERDLGRPAARLAHLYAAVDDLHARRARAEADYRAGKVSRAEYIARDQELKECLLAAGLEMYDIYAASGRERATRMFRMPPTDPR